MKPRVGKLLTYVSHVGVGLEIRLTHLSNVFLRTAEINEHYIDEIGTVAHGYGLLLECILRPHRNDLPQFKILQDEGLIVLHALVTEGSQIRLEDDH